MGAVGITLAVFACWSIIGYALTSSLLPRRQALSNLLLAPVVGMGTLELLAHIGLRFDSPIGPIAYALVFGALLVAITVLLIRRPPFPLRRVLPFSLILLAAIPLSGRPLFRWGYDWIANANSDMANYSLGATGFREHGFRMLHIDEYFTGENLTYDMWSLYTDRVGHRHGCEMSLAMVSAITSRPVPFIFMPVILAMHLVLISSVGFLLYRLVEGKRVALISCGLMALSPLSTYAVVQQLIAQVGGLAILVAGTGFFLRPARRLPTYGLLKRSLLGGIIAATLMLHYTESAPFLVTAFGLHVAVGFARGRRDFKQLAIAILSAALVVPLIGNFLVANIAFLMLQASQGQAGGHPTLIAIFPQYLTAEGFARLWGFATLYEPVVVSPQSPWPIHRLVLAGALGLVLSLAAGIALTWRRQPVGAILLVIGAVAIVLWRATAAFALFKLAMYAQPFIIGSIVLGWARMNSGYWKWAGLLCLIALIPLQYSIQRTYVSYSGDGLTAGGDTPGATEEHLFAQYWDALRTPGAKRFVVPVNDMVSRKLVASCSQGVTLCIPTFDLKLLVHPLELEGPFHPRWKELLNFPLRAPNAGAVWKTAPKDSGSIALHDPNNPEAASELTSVIPAWIDQPQPGDYLLEPPERFALFNRFSRSPDTRACRVVPLTDVSNHLILRPSTRSKTSDAFLGEASGLCPLQADPLFPKDTLAAAGQYLTFQVLNPSPRVRLLISGTSTFIPGNQDLPPAAVVGDKRILLPLIGQGAARIVSEPISAQTVGNSKYLLLDLAPAAFPNSTTYSGAWDPRQISLYLRDVSLLSEEEYVAVVPPECLKAFPADLAQKNVEYSGCGEEGSVGKHSWFRLSQPQTSAPLVVRGRLAPGDSGTQTQNELLLKWNGVPIRRQTIGTREFEVRVPLPPGEKTGKLELEFSEAQSLPSPATRQVSAQLTFVGFER